MIGIWGKCIVLLIVRRDYLSWFVARPIKLFESLSIHLHLHLYHILYLYQNQQYEIKDSYILIQKKAHQITSRFELQPKYQAKSIDIYRSKRSKRKQESISTNLY